jgi:hypothetical protein
MIFSTPSLVEFLRSSIDSENRLNMYLNANVYSLIPTEGENSTSEGSREDCKVAVSEHPKVVGHRLLHLARMTTSLTSYNIFIDIPTCAMMLRWYVIFASNT